MTPVEDIDVLESTLRRKGALLDILLRDRTTGRNIIWATDSYVKYGKEFAPKRQMNPQLVTGVYGKLIQPRAAKSLAEQRQRTKDKAEVFTPLDVVDQMNKSVDWAGDIRVPDATNWQDYVRELKLEITCGEAPFIVSRYNPTVHGAHIKDIKRRVGFLDRKLRVVGEFCKTKKDWLYWAKEAYKASYGYEWQGDNILIARENLLYTMIDYYKHQFKTDRTPSLAIQQEFAEIISWNIFQMDGIKYVVPMSCKHEITTIPGLPLFNEPDTVEKNECEGCKFNRPAKHNGKYAKIMDWVKKEKVQFIDILALDFTDAL